MRQHDIDLKKMIANGDIQTEWINHVLHINTKTQNTRFYQLEQPINSYLHIPQKFKLPLRIDLHVKMDAPSLYLILGKGHVTFGTSFLDNRRIGDIIEPDIKKIAAFDNSLEMNQYADLSIVYGLHYMQVLMNGEERFFSKKEKYMKSPLLDELNKEGFDLKIAGSKQSNLMIDFLTVTEFNSDDTTDLTLKRGKSNNSNVCLSIDKKAKSDFSECISKLSSELQNEIRGINDYLLNSKNLKIKRKMEGTSQACKVSYISSYGFSYSIHISENIADHFFWWYMVSNYTYENKYMGRKNDYTTETLNKIAQTSPNIAEQLFDYYDECSGCSKDCHVKTFYEFAGRKKAVCHGQMKMNMNILTFQNLHPMFKALNEILN